MLCRVVIAGIAALASLAAQVRVTGRVVSDTNAPVANAALEVRSASGDRYRTLTDPSGAFALEVRAAGEVLVDVERSGFFALKNLRLAAGSAEWHLVLNPVREMSESVDVTSSSSAVTLDQATSENRLAGANLVDVPYPTTHNLKNAMRILPGVVQDNIGGIHVNGGGEDQVSYLMDGFNIADPLTGRLESRVSVEAVQTMEVMTGRFSAEYGKGSAGVLSVNTRMGDDRVRYSATNFIPGVENVKGLRIGSWTPRVNFSGPIRRGRAWFSDSLTGQYDQTVIRELPAGQDRGTSWRMSNLLRAQVNLAATNILYAGLLTNHFSAARTGLSALDPAETTVDRRSRQWFFDVKDQVYLSARAVIEFGYASNRTFARQIPQGPDFLVFTPDGRRGNYFVNGVQEASRDQILANAFLPAFTLWGDHQVKTGADLNRLRYHQDLNRTGFEYYSASALVRRVTYVGEGRLGKSNFESALYLQDAWRVRRNLLLEIGLRADRDRILKNWNVSPRIGAAWSPGRLENTKISGGYAVTYDATNLQLFTRPLDQVAVTTYFPPYGSGDEPVRALFTIPPQQYASPRFSTWSASLDQRIGSGMFVKVQGLKRRGKRGFTFDGVSPGPDAVYELSNRRADAYDSLELTFRHSLRKQYEWIASYTRSRAASDAVVDLSPDQPAVVGDNFGRLPWDTPNRLVSWGYFPTPWEKWAVAYLAEYRTGFPFSVQNNAGFIIGNVNSLRYPAFFELNLHVERKFNLRGQQWALRVGCNNITGRSNPNAVINSIESERFMSFFGGQGRATVFRIRWLGRL